MAEVSFTLIVAVLLVGSYLVHFTVQCASPLYYRWKFRRLAPDPRITRSEVLLKEGNSSGADALLDEVIRTGSAHEAAHAHVCMAGRLYSVGEPEVADRHLEEALRLGPRHEYVLAYARALRGLIRLYQGGFEQALDDCNKGVAIDPTSADTYAMRAVVLAHLARHSEAVADASEALRLRPGYSYAWRVRGAAYFHLGQSAKAVSDLRQAIKLEPSNAEAHASLAEALVAEGHADTAGNAADRALSLSSDSDELYHRCGRIWLECGDTKRCLECLKRALALNLENLFAANELAWHLATHPDPEIRNGNRAIELAKQACHLEQVPSAEFLGTLAAAHAESGNFDEALRILETAFSLDPVGENARTRARMLVTFRQGRAFHTDPVFGGRSAFYIRRAEGYCKRGELSAAVAEYEAALVDDPTNIPLLVLCGMVLRKVGRSSDALAHLERAVTLDREDDLAQNNLAWMLATDTTANVRDGNRAIAHAQESCRLTDYRYWCWIDTLAAAYAEHGDFRQAVQWQERAIELAPENEKEELRLCLNHFREGTPLRDES